MKRKIFNAPSGASIPFTRLGFGSAPLGNLYAALSENEAQDVLAAMWRAGHRYIDTSPLYGLGLSETRLNHFLRGKKRSDYVISTKVGRLLQPCPPSQRTGIGKFFDCPSRHEVFDYSYDGVMRSMEASLERLGLDAVDILFVHDIDVFTHGSAGVRDGHVKTFLEGGYKALIKLRNEKAISAFGAGINEWQVGETLVKACDFDLFLLAGRYTLLEQEALNSFLPLCEERGIGIVLGGVFNSGILASGPKPGAMYDYHPAPPAILKRVAAIEAICKAHGVKLAEAALQFPFTHPSVVSVIPGASSPKQIAFNINTISKRIPKTMWKDLKSAGLMDERAPT